MLVAVYYFLQQTQQHSSILFDPNTHSTLTVHHEPCEPFPQIHPAYDRVPTTIPSCYSPLSASGSALVV